MKIRTDFVTNSSSSSFSVEVSIVDQSGRRYSLDVDPNEYDSENGGTAYFSENLRNAMTKFVNKDLEGLEDKYELDVLDNTESIKTIESVKVGDKARLVNRVESFGDLRISFIDVQHENGSLGLLPIEASRILKNYLNDNSVNIEVTVVDIMPQSQDKNASVSIHIDANVKNNSGILRFSDIADLCRFLTDSIEFGCWETEFKEDLDAKKTEFSTDVIKRIKTIDNISKITVTRRYRAWGEEADCITNNDQTLCDLAYKVNDAKGTKREAAKAELLKYISTPNGNRGINFGAGFKDFEYSWYSNDDMIVEALVKRLCRDYAPDREEGTEYREIDMKTGEYTEYARLELD